MEEWKDGRLDAPMASMAIQHGLRVDEVFCIHYLIHPSFHPSTLPLSRDSLDAFCPAFATILELQSAGKGRGRNHGRSAIPS